MIDTLELNRAVVRAIYTPSQTVVLDVIDDLQQCDGDERLRHEVDAAEPRCV